MVDIQAINVGLAPNDKKGDPLRDAFVKANLNFSALNIAIQGVLDGKGQANGFASLGADGRLLAAQAPVVYSAALPTTAHDLNTYVTPGTFYQTTVAGATAPNGLNYPLAQVGFLEVVATGTPVLQVYTTRVSGLTSQRFWRVRVSSASWSTWKEITDTSGVLGYVGAMAAAQDLNSYTQRGIWVVGSSAIAAGGTNFPIGQSGSLIVYSAGYPGGATATGCTQFYNAANSGQVFTRSLVSAAWTPWVRQVDASMIGVANGVGGLGADGRAPVSQFPLSFALVTGTDANTVTSAGVYYTNSDAQATAALNWPEQLAGTLLVEAAAAGNSQVTQTYTTRNGSGGVLRTYKRVRFGTTGVWGTWQQLARYDDAMTKVLLSAPTDANVLAADNVWYWWVAANVFTGGSNWPAISNVASGWVDVRVLNASTVLQTLTVPVSGGKPRIFQRYGNSTTNVWQAWWCISPMSRIEHLPTADCGDIYVDGAGWHRWNGTAYALASLAATLPTTAHDLNTYQAPGEYRQASTAGAMAGSNYPVAIGGLLEVVGTGVAGQTKQVYTVASSANVSLTAGPRQFWRMAINTAWSPWQEVLTSALGMTHQFLTAATDANTLTADNTFYSWTASAVAGGANFPGYSAAGYMQVFWNAATVVSQELTLLVTGGKPLKFARFGNTSTGVWQPWKVTSAFNTTGWMPSSNMGDIYVDGDGFYRWNGTAYVRSNVSSTSIGGKVDVIAGKGGQGYVLNSSGNTLTMGWSGTNLNLMVDSTSQGIVWTSGNNTAGGGWRRSADGVIHQWGYVTATGDSEVAFPIAFPTACEVIFTAMEGNPGATQALTAMVDGRGLTTFAFRKRYINNGGAVGPATQLGTYFAIGR